MPLPAHVREIAMAQVDRFCDERVPEAMRSEMRLEQVVRGSVITIVERRPPWSALIGPEWTSMNIAQLRYDDADPAPDVGPLLAAIDEDPTGSSGADGSSGDRTFDVGSAKPRVVRGARRLRG
jgi:hypothetical protein